MNQVKEAVSRLGYGGQTKLAKKLNIKPQNVQHWCLTGVIPAKHVINVEKATGISRHILRPDLYPRKEKAA